MASQKNKRRSRKGRQTRSGSAGASRAATATPTQPQAKPKSPAPRAVKAVSGGSDGRPLSRREQREERQREAAARSHAANRLLGTYGERPGSIFGPVPVSEICILLGLIAVIIGAINGGGPALVVGVIVCVFGVLEFTVRDHFSGYRSHTSLLAAFPAVVVELLIAAFVGIPKSHVFLLLPVIPVFGFSFWLLQRQFRNARHARVTKSPR